MGKFILKKVIVALVAAILVAAAVMFLLPVVLTDLHLADASVVTADNLFAVSGMSAFLALVGVLVFVAALLGAFIAPVRRRRFRNSGTVIETDVEDGRERGVVKWFNVKKGFGFITWDDGEDVFVHFRSIRGQGHRSLTEGQRVKFAVVRGQKGPQAEDVSAVR